MTPGPWGRPPHAPRSAFVLNALRRDRGRRAGRQSPRHADAGRVGSQSSPAAEEAHASPGGEGRPLSGPWSLLSSRRTESVLRFCRDSGTRVCTSQGHAGEAAAAGTGPRGPHVEGRSPPFELERRPGLVLRGSRSRWARAPSLQPGESPFKCCFIPSRSPAAFLFVLICTVWRELAPV